MARDLDRILDYVAALESLDTVGIEPVPRADSFAQFYRCAVRIAVQRAGEGFVCFDRLRARAERTFVRRQFDDAVDPFDLRCARHIGRHVHDAGARRYRGHQASPVSAISPASKGVA